MVSCFWNLSRKTRFYSHIPVSLTLSRLLISESPISGNTFSLFTKINRNGPKFHFHGSKSLFNTAAHPLGDKRVGFENVSLPEEFKKNLGTLGVKDLKLFQYLIFKLLGDSFSHSSDSTQANRFLRLVFYNEPGSGQSIGSLLPLLYLYSSHNRRVDPKDSTKTPAGSLLVLCSRSSCSNIFNLLLAVNPAVKCLLLDSNTDSRSSGSRTVGEDFALNLGTQMNSVVRESALFTEGSYHIILASHKALLRVSERRRTRNLPLLSRVSCVLFEDFSELISTDSGPDTFSRNLNLVKHTKSLLSPGHEGRTNFHVICLINSLGDAFHEFSKKHLSSYSLYDFKSGARQRLLSDDRTDVLKVDVEFGGSEVISLESGEAPERRGTEHSICKVSKSGKYERVKVLKNLVYSYLGLPTFMYSQPWPQCIKPPTAKSKCIIFVSNRKQLTVLGNMQEFSSLCVYLGRHLSVYERAKSIAAFNAGSRPIMLATDNSVHGSSFENVGYLFNFNPPKTPDSYRSRANYLRKGDTLCLTLYSKDQYPGLVKVIKGLLKKISVHVVPSEEYMAGHDLQWMRMFTRQILAENRSLITPYLPKSAEILDRFGDSALVAATNVLLRDGVGSFSWKEASLPKSILSGRSGFTAISISDVSRQHLNDESDVQRILAGYLPEEKIGSVVGKCQRTEGGYIVDVSNRHLKSLLELSRENPDIYVQVPTVLPKMVLGETNAHIGKVHRRGLPWDSLRVRKPPKLDSKRP